jgi:hypothetical protein
MMTEAACIAELLLSELFARFVPRMCSHVVWQALLSHTCMSWLAVLLPAKGVDVCQGFVLRSVMGKAARTVHA